MKYLLSVLVTVTAYCCSAQICFEKYIGGSSQKYAYSVKQCYDHGYIVSGHIINGAYNLFVARLNEQGDTLWTRTFGGMNMVGFDVIQCRDSNFIVSGYKGGSGGLVMKLGLNGDTAWSKVIGNWGQSVQQAYDGGFIIAGYSLKKLSAAGNLIWDKAINQAMYVIQTPDSGIVAACYATQQNKISLRKTNIGGVDVWTKNYYGTFINPTNNVVARTADGGFVLTGQDTAVSSTVDTGAGAILIRTNATGDELWRKSIPAWFGAGVVQSPDGGFAICGRALNKLVLIKTDTGGNFLWKKSFGSSNVSTGMSIQKTSDGGYVMAGMGNGDFYIVKTDGNGIVVSQGIQQTQNKNKLTIYPNPFSEKVNILFEKEIVHGKIELVDGSGKLVSCVENVHGAYFSLPRNQLAAGIYTLIIHDGAQVIAKEKIQVTD